MPRRLHLALAAAVPALAAAAPAFAKVYAEWKPRMSLLAGMNDNVLLDGSGGDGFGQARPGIRLDLYGEHQLHADFDCQAGIGRLLHPEKFAQDGGAFASAEQCIVHYRDHWSPRTSSNLALRSHMTVLQALAMAGGLAEFADRGEITVLHADGTRHVVDYDDLVNGKVRRQLSAGDTVVVP